MLWRVLFLVVYLIYFLIRSVHLPRIRNTDERKTYISKLGLAREREGKIMMSYRSLLSFIMLVGIIVYVVNPLWLYVLSLPIPLWLRLVGLGLALITLPLLSWTHRVLGRHYSPHLELQQGHKLVTSGPYRLVRHPMYTILISFMLGISLFSANAIIVVPHLLAIHLLILRINNEEAMLMNEFGDEYSEYMTKAGKLLPKMNNSN